MAFGSWQNGAANKAIIVTITVTFDGMDEGEGYPVVLTSTTTIEVEGPGAPVLRMFNIDAHALTSGNPSQVGEWNEEAQDRVCYLDSDPLFEFNVAPSSDVPEPTDVPSRSRQSGWLYEKIEGIHELGSLRLPATTELRGTFDAVYKDPCVVAVPEAWGGGWLMILVRSRAKVGEAAGGPPGTALTDIVAWWCATPDFRGSSLKGPYLLVHSLEALADVNSELISVFSGDVIHPLVPYRVWMGVPTGAFFSGRFYIWYVAHPNCEGRDFYIDAVKYDDDFFRHIVVKRFERATIEEAVANGPLVPELDWDKTHAVPGSMRLPIRVWMALSENSVTPLTSRIAVKDGKGYAWLADPEAQVCTSSDGDERLLLLVASILAEEGHEWGKMDGLGIWRCRGIVDGARLRPHLTSSLTIPLAGGPMIVAEEARDFMVAPMDLSGRSTDRLACSTITSGDDGEHPEAGLLLDPDLIVTSDGTWRCYVGTAYHYTGSGEADYYLQWIEPEGDDPRCARWDSAWNAERRSWACPLPGHDWPRRTCVIRHTRAPRQQKDG